MKYVGIDFGTKKIGIAISDESGSIAFPRGIVPNDEKLFAHLLRLIEDEKIGCIVVGDTRALNGGENIASPEADAFIQKLKETVLVPIKRGFEAWSSIEASRFAPPGKMRDDSSAAAIILQRFLDMKRRVDA